MHAPPRCTRPDRAISGHLASRPDDAGIRRSVAGPCAGGCGQQRAVLTRSPGPDRELAAAVVVRLLPGQAKRDPGRAHMRTPLNADLAVGRTDLGHDGAQKTLPEDAGYSRPSGKLPYAGGGLGVVDPWQALGGVVGDRVLAADAWPLTQGRAARVDTLDGTATWVRVRGRQRPEVSRRQVHAPRWAPADARVLLDARRGPEIQHALVFEDGEGAAVGRAPLHAVSHPARLLRIPGAAGSPELAFGPVDVAVMRRLVTEAGL